MEAESLRRPSLLLVVIAFVAVGVVSGTASAQEVDVGAACVNATGQAECWGAAASGTGNTADSVAVSGTGDAVGSTAASGTGNATGCGTLGDGRVLFPCVAATGGGRAQGDSAAIAGAGPARSDLVAVSGTGNATGPVPVSAVGGCRSDEAEPYRPCIDARAQDDAQGYYAAASAAGDAHGPLAGISGTGNATSAGAAASGAGDATAHAVSISGSGGADVECKPHPPIRITEDHGGNGFNWTNPVTGEDEHRPGSGVVAGNGSAGNPYVIAGWCITPKPYTYQVLPSAGILIRNTSAHVVLRNNVVDGLNVQKDGVRLETAPRVTLRDNNITHNANGVVVSGSDGVALRDNTLTRNAVGVRLDHAGEATLRDNALGAGGLLISGDKLGHYRHQIDATNTVNGEPLRYVRGRADVTVPSPAGQVVLVDTENARVEGLDLSRTTTGLQMAFTADTTAAHNTITHNTGDGVLLRNADSPTIRDNAIRRNGDAGVLFEDTDRATLHDNTIARNGVHGLNLRDADRTSLHHNTIARNGNLGVLLDGSWRTALHNNTVTGNDRFGFYLSYSADAVVENNTVAGGEHGFVLDHSDEPVLHNNTVEDPRTTGIGLWDSSDATVRRNTVTESGVDGILLVRSHRSTVPNNVATDNGNGVVLLDTSEATVENNTLPRNGNGVLVLESSGATIQSNAVTDNDERGVLLRDSGGTRLRNNNIHDNGDAGLEVRRGSQPSDATDNYWGAANGPSGGVTDACTGTSADGDGAEIDLDDGGEVCFDPWLTSPNTDAGAN